MTKPIRTGKIFTDHTGRWPTPAFRRHARSVATVFQRSNWLGTRLCKSGGREVEVAACDVKTV